MVGSTNENVGKPLNMTEIMSFCVDWCENGNHLEFFTDVLFSWRAQSQEIYIASWVRYDTP